MEGGNAAADTAGNSGKYILLHYLEECIIYC